MVCPRGDNHSGILQVRKDLCIGGIACIAPLPPFLIELLHQGLKPGDLLRGANVEHARFPGCQPHLGSLQVGKDLFRQRKLSLAACQNQLAAGVFLQDQDVGGS